MPSQLLRRDPLHPRPARPDHDRRAKNAGIGRTAVYNYFADMGELLVAYALDETERFLNELRVGLEGIENPIDQLAVYIRLQINDLARRHLPPGPAMRSMLSPESYAKLGKHVHELQMVLAHILSAAIAENYIPRTTFANWRCSYTVPSPQVQVAPEDAPDEETRERQILNTIRFIQMGLGARFDAEGNPVRLDSEESLPEQSPVQEANLKIAS